ncbi:MAG: 3-deoxy-D-manno-octulosonate 8-phosphate phosphatase (KDO 8-P phosphatase) [Planctomycetota bacterium]|jgi:3-deoxy-D-manno-octulosonate 8-phosphate phosphatase (KDO 8-P phosphatase)
MGSFEINPMPGTLEGRPEVVDKLDQLAQMKLIVLDIDGTLTDGQIMYSGDGDVQRYNVHDGQGLVWLRRFAGMKQAWISGRSGPAAIRRSGDLKIDEVHLGVGPKAQVLQEVQKKLGIGPEHTISMGDDLPDLALAAHSALFVAPKNARIELIKRADFVTKKGGGKGAVREVCEWLLYAQGQWPKILEENGG